MILLTPHEHIVASISNRNYIVDTGSPFSFNYEGLASLEIENRTFGFFQKAVCPKEVADELTGIDISGFIGMDIIKKTGLTIDFENQKIDFFADTDVVDPKDYASLSFDLFMENYLVTNDIYLGHRLNNAIIDTGAWVPYISNRLAAHFEHTGQEYIDKSPIYGELQGEYLKGEMTLRSSSREITRFVNMGTMPMMLDSWGMFDAVFGVKALTDKKIIIDFDKMVLLAKI